MSVAFQKVICFFFQFLKTLPLALDLKEKKND